MMRFILIALLVLCLLNSTYVYADLCPEGDINGDCGVDCGDLLEFSNQWLTTIEECPSPGCADLDDSNFVDLRDFSVFSGGWGEKVGPVVINEFMASNSNFYEDPDESDEYPDWIEVYNVSRLEVDLGGMYLTDDSGEPMQWEIPQGISIGSGQFVVFIADGEDGQGIFHTNFQLSAGGEEVGIYDGESERFLDVIDYRDIEQTADISYGRYPDGNDVLRFFATPTPGYGNEDAYLGEVADTKFSHDRGFYEDANTFDLVISCATEGDEIRYTIDGSEPNLINGFIFDSNNPIHINSTSTIRAAAFKPGWLETDVDTHTYIFLDDVITQETMDTDIVNDPAYSGVIKDALKSIPTLSIVMNWDDMFGIGGAYYTSEYEKETSIELIYSDGREGFQTNCGVQRHSNASPKTSLRLEFKSEYGDSSLDYSLFESAPLHNDTAVDKFDRIILRSGKNQSWTDGRFKELVT